MKTKNALSEEGSGVVEGLPPTSEPLSDEGNQETRTNNVKPCLRARVDTLHAVKPSFTITTDVIPIADMDHLLS
jgi:hypothetical protein